MSTATTARRPVEPHPLNIPNQLTASRFVLAIALFVLIAQEEWVWCIGVFALAALTDWLDGYLARRWELGSTLGRNLDPLVDKILICGAFTFLIPVAGAAVYPWMVVVVISRELVVTSLRSFFETRGGKFGADWLGKLKMGLQCAALLAVFLHLALPEVAPETYSRSWVLIMLLRDVLLYAMVIATVLSGLQYLWRAAMLLRAEE